MRPAGCSCWLWAAAAQLKRPGGRAGAGAGVGAGARCTRALQALGGLLFMALAWRLLKEGAVSS